jgi:hypothetical protein
MIELVVVLRKMEIGRSYFVRHEVRAIYQRPVSHRDDELCIGVAGVRKYDLSPVLEIASVPVNIFKL